MVGELAGSHTSQKSQTGYAIVHRTRWERSDTNLPLARSTGILEANIPIYKELRESHIKFLGHVAQKDGLRLPIVGGQGAYDPVPGGASPSDFRSTFSIMRWQK